MLKTFAKTDSNNYKCKIKSLHHKKLDEQQSN